MLIGNRDANSKVLLVPQSSVAELFDEVAREIAREGIESIMYPGIAACVAATEGDSRDA